MQLPAMRQVKWIFERITEMIFGWSAVSTYKNCGSVRSIFRMSSTYHEIILRGDYY